VNQRSLLLAFHLTFHLRARFALRNISSWTANATRIASASASHRRVEPSTSVNRNVTTPEGAAAADTLTGFHKERRPAPNIGTSDPVIGCDVFRDKFSGFTHVVYCEAVKPLA
jgi:hypothetical protein